MNRTRAQESRAAIERIYIIMRHLFIRGSYKPMGISGESLIQSLKVLSPEIYGVMLNEVKVELQGLLYVLERLPEGIEECRYVRLISREGYENSSFEQIVPPKRRRNCYRVDKEQMFIEMTRGRSDIYDILTHLTFLYIESEKIRKNSVDHKGRSSMDWKQLEEIMSRLEQKAKFDHEAAISYLSKIIGRTFEETLFSFNRFKAAGINLFKVVYHLGRCSMEEARNDASREIFFSSTLRERIGHHVYGELWADHIKSIMVEHGLIQRPLHVVSANLHSFVNTIYGTQSLEFKTFKDLEKTAEKISLETTGPLAGKIRTYAKKHGLIDIPDVSGTNISVQIIDTAKMDQKRVGPGVPLQKYDEDNAPVLLVMDYAFGEQAYECLDELLKPFDNEKKTFPLQVQSVSIMGKAGILKGKKGDIMIPSSHIFEGTADNYPFRNELRIQDFQGFGLGVCAGPMITVLGTSLQNRNVLKYFMESSWKTIGLEMEGAHYQKAIQSASRIRHSIRRNVKLLYAYYASDNPLETGSTLASGGLGKEGIRPTYLITLKILEKIFKA